MNREKNGWFKSLIRLLFRLTHFQQKDDQSQEAGNGRSDDSHEESQLLVGPSATNWLETHPGDDISNRRAEVKFFRIPSITVRHTELLLGPGERVLQLHAIIAAPQHACLRRESIRSASPEVSLPACNSVLYVWFPFSTRYSWSRRRNWLVAKAWK